MEVLDKILNAATELFRQYGFKTITMDDIARRSGISKKTLYQQFGNKEEVVEAAMLHFHNHSYEACTGLSQSSDNAVEAMANCMLVLDEVCGRINPIAMLELSRFYPGIYARMHQESMAATAELLRQNIAWGKQEGLYREELNADLLAHYRIAVLRMLNRKDTLLTERFPPREVFKALSEHFIYGLLTPKGEKLYFKYKATHQQQASEL